MPALVNISVGSPLTTMGAEGTILCPFFSKKSKKACLICADVQVLLIREAKLVHPSKNEECVGKF